MPDNPIRLAKAPIVDCTVELRYGESSPAVGDILPGMLYERFKSEYPQTEATPASQIPKPIRASESGLKYSPVVQFKGLDSIIGIGDLAIQITYKRPYPGWDIVRPRCEAVLAAAMDTGLIHGIERLSIRYNNLIDVGEDNFDLSPLELTFEMGRDLVPRGPGTAIRAEFLIEDTTTIVEVKPGAEADIGLASGGREKASGVLLAIDTIAFGNIENAEELKATLALVHSVERRVFFQMITGKTRDSLDPIWE